MISYGIKCTYSVVNAMLRTILSARDASGVRPVPDAGSPDFPLSVSLLSLDTLDMSLLTPPDSGKTPVLFLR